MKLVYFAWVRERIGLTEETVDLPATVTTAGDLVRWLAGRGDNYAHAFEALDAIRVAVDHEHVDQESPVRDAREVALFPPMTGG